MSGYLTMLGWAFLPSLATSWIQSIYYGITIRAGDPKPQPGSHRFNSHRRTIHILVIATYLFYTIYEADHDLLRTGSYYNDLRVALNSTDREVKSRFRRLAAMHHPDKAGAADAQDSAAFFMHLKLASDTLQDTAKRFAYERFGPEIGRWQKCVNIKDYVTRGVISGILPHYAVAAASIYVLGLFGYMDFGKYYRWLILVALCVFELRTVSRPDFPPFVTAVNAVLTRVTTHPPFLPFQVISLARKLTITVYIALSQIGPLVAAQIGTHKPPPEDAKALQQSLGRLESLAQQLDGDAVRLLDMEMAPYKGDADATANLRGKMREWLVQNTIRADPMVRDALGTSLRKRRVDAPAGAKGNR